MLKSLKDKIQYIVTSFGSQYLFLKQETCNICISKFKKLKKNWSKLPRITLYIYAWDKNLFRSDY